MCDVHSDLCESDQLAETLLNAAKEARLRKEQQKQVEEERRQEEKAAEPPSSDLLSPDADTGWEEFSRPRANSRTLSL